MDIKESINDTRKGFEESFASGDFYNRQTRDSEHLARKKCQRNQQLDVAGKGKRPVINPREG